jgi:hypothetical protein
MKRAYDLIVRKRAIKRDRQRGRAILRLLGDRGDILFPDRGAPPLKIRIHKYHHHPGDGFGSHMNGRHKLG